MKLKQCEVLSLIPEFVEFLSNISVWDNSENAKNYYQVHKVLKQMRGYEYDNDCYKIVRCSIEKWLINENPRGFYAKEILIKLENRVK